MKTKSDPQCLDEFPKKRVGAQQFVKATLGWMFPTMIDKLPINPSDEIWLRYEPPHELEEFPGNPDLDDFGTFVSSGIASYYLDNQPQEPCKEGEPRRFSARQIEVFDEDRWLCECTSVLEEHRWMSGDLRAAQHLIEKLSGILGSNCIADLKASHPQNWNISVCELAALHFSTPLSRVWYVANMLALYYIHRDFLKVGFLWNEYNTRIRYEVFILKYMEMMEKNRENGAKGGQADRKADRYRVLNEIGRRRSKEIAFVTDNQGVRLAMRWAAEYDAKAEVPLFRLNGRPLSKKWYAEWLADFRLKAKGVEWDQALRRT